MATDKFTSSDARDETEAPNHSNFEPPKGDSFLVIGSDGLFDKMTS